MFGPTQRILSYSETSFLDYCKLNNPDELFSQCESLHFLHRPKIEGTTSKCNRDIIVLSDVAPGYHLSKQSNYELPSQPMPLYFSELLSKINEHFKEDYNLFLINCYEDHNDSISAHYDDKYGYGNVGVVTISLGSTREYQMIDKNTNRVEVSFKMRHGDVLTMSNDLQKTHLHAVPPSRVPCGKRISITTRHIVPERDFKKVCFEKCLVCGTITKMKSKVCWTCYPLNKFQCPECLAPSGAPWACLKCYEKSKN
jgi:alkylated DNA repair dioxygenase AlkB